MCMNGVPEHKVTTRFLNSKASTDVDMLLSLIVCSRKRSCFNSIHFSQLLALGTFDNSWN